MPPDSEFAIVDKIASAQGIDVNQIDMARESNRNGRIKLAAPDACSLEKSMFREDLRLTPRLTETAFALIYRKSKSTINI